MAVMFGADALEGVIGMRDAIDLVEWMARHEAAGRTFVSPRLTTRFEGGWMRMMFAADYESGYAATKAFHMIEGVDPGEPLVDLLHPQHRLTERHRLLQQEALLRRVAAVDAQD